MYKCSIPLLNMFEISFILKNKQENKQAHIFGQVILIYISPWHPFSTGNIIKYTIHK